MRTRKDSPARGNARSLNGEALLAAVRWIVDDGIFDQWKFHGNTNWRPFELVMLAVVWAWSDCSTLTGTFQEAHRWSMNVLGRAAATTYQGLMGALVTSTGRLLPRLWSRMHELLEQHGCDHWRIGPWLPLAIDGSRVTTARTKANERAFCAANYGPSGVGGSENRRRQCRRFLNVSSAFGSQFVGNVDKQTDLTHVFIGLAVFQLAMIPLVVFMRGNSTPSDVEGPRAEQLESQSVEGRE